MNWPRPCVRRNEPLANHTSFRIGGPADWYAEPSTMEDLLVLLRAAAAQDVPVSVVGGGTNLLVPDRGVRGLVIRLGSGFRMVEIVPDDGLRTEALVRCGAAVMTQRLVSFAAQHGWDGFELMAGLPGQVGGAVIMNAQQIGRFVERVRLVTTAGEVQELDRRQLRFAYRYSAIDPGIVVDVLLRVTKTDPAAAAARIQQALRYRNDTQDTRLPSAGCAFRNPPGASAGRLIDQAGLKGSRVGDAQVSLRHANFIINDGQATCDDVLSLMEHIQRAVHRTFGVWLEPEVRLFGERWHAR